MQHVNSAFLSRSPAILQAHLAQFAGIPLGLGDCKRYRSYAANRPLSAFGRAIICFHKFVSDPPNVFSTIITDILDSCLDRRNPWLCRAHNRPLALFRSHHGGDFDNVATQSAGNLHLGARKLLRRFLVAELVDFPTRPNQDKL